MAEPSLRQIPRSELEAALTRCHFGTVHLPAGKWPEDHGNAGHPLPLGYRKQFLYPFRR